MLRSLWVVLLLSSLPPAVAADTVRVATLLPFVEGAVAAAPGDAKLVAAVRRSMREPERTDVIDLGNAHRPSLERLAEAEADVVVGDALLHTGHRDPLDRVAGDVLLIDTSSIDSTFAGLLELAKRTGSEAALSERIGVARAAITAQAQPEPIPVLALFGTPGTFLVVSEHTWLGDLMAALNFRNLAASAGASEHMPGYLDVSHEKIATLEPELVLLVAHGDPRAIQRTFEERVGSGGPWRSIGRSAFRGVHVVDPALFTLNPGLDLPEAAAALLRLAEPEPDAVGAGDAREGDPAGPGS